MQAGALVHVYTDGTCLVSHGGVEMGQGLHTKVAQIAAQELGIPLADVFIAETATDKVANASPTAASASSDLYGSAGSSPGLLAVNFLVLWCVGHCCLCLLGPVQRRMYQHRLVD